MVKQSGLLQDVNYYNSRKTLTIITKRSLLDVAATLDLAWGIMVEGNNDIFYAGDDAIRYLVGQIHKKYSMIFIWGYPFITCGSYDQFFDYSHIPSCAHAHVRS